MNSEITKYAPIFWFHYKEKFLPIDVKALVEISELYKDNKKVTFSGNIDDLAELENRGKGYWLNIPGIDLGYSEDDNYLIYSIYGKGIDYTIDFIYDIYERIKNNFKKVVYARHRQFEIRSQDFSEDVFSGNWREYNKLMIGEYDVYQYFPFYIFNDFTNLHIGDWDSTVQIYVNNTHNYCWIRTHAHNYAWLTKMDRRNRYRNIRSWLNKWDNDKEVKDIFNLQYHPFIFVSKGGHGCYPTPGYTIRGIDFVVELPIAFEEREIAKKCLIPGGLSNEFDMEEKDIIKLLKSSEINTTDLDIERYELVDFDRQKWSSFKGRWGNRSNYSLWDSPTSALHKPEFRITKRNFIRNFQSEFRRGYKPELVFENYHGILES